MKVIVKENIRVIFYLKYPASPRSIQDPRAIIQDTLHPTGDSSQHRETLANIFWTSRLSNTSIEIGSVLGVGSIWSVSSRIEGFFSVCRSGVGTRDVTALTVLGGGQKATLLALLK